MTFAVRLDVFEGPLDLLLQLVSKERVDVSDVSISKITDDFLRALEGLEIADLDDLSSFLVLAATLLELKSLKLLPHEAAADPEVAALLEERDLLLHRLVGYATFKAAAAAVGEALARGEGFFVRTAGISEELAASVPDPVGPIDPARLAELASRLFTRRPAVSVDTSFVAPVRVSLSDAMQWLTSEIRTRGKASFTELCRSIARIEVVVRFLALLELARHDRIDLEQNRPFGEIVIRWREPLAGAGADGAA